MTDNMPRAVAGRRETKSIVFVLSLFIDSRLVKLLSSAGCCQTSVPNSKNLCSSELASPDYQKEEKSIFLFVSCSAFGFGCQCWSYSFSQSGGRMRAAKENERGIGRTKSHGNLSELTWTKRFSAISAPMSRTVLMCVCTLEGT